MISVGIADSNLMLMQPLGSVLRDVSPYLASSYVVRPFIANSLKVALSPHSGQELPGALKNKDFAGQSLHDLSWPRCQP